MNAPVRHSGILRHVPNLLSGVRIAAVPLLAVLAFTGHESAFTWVLIPALLTDIADGLVARLQGHATYQSVVAGQANFDKLMYRINEWILEGMKKGADSRIITLS